MGEVNGAMLENGLTSSEVGARIQKMDWSQTSLGALKTWSHSFRLTLSILLQAANPMVLVWGSDRLVFYNDAYHRRQSNPMPLAQPISTYQTPGWKDVQADVAQVFATGQPRQRQSQSECGQGIYASALQSCIWSYSAIWDETGQIAGVLLSGWAEIPPLAADAAGSDETERQQAEAALRRSEERYRALFESIDEGFCICEMLFDQNGEPQDYRFLEVNPMFEAMTGLQQAVGKTARELVPNLEAFWFETYGRVVKTGEPIRFENQSMALNRWFDVNAFRVGDPQYHQFALLFTNITDRKQVEVDLRESEERFRNMADNAPFMVWVTDPTGACTYLSQSWYDFTGQTEATGLGLGWLDAVHPDDDEDVKALFLAANQRHDAFRLEYRLRRRDGHYIWVIDAASPWFGGDGQFKGYIGSVIDISGRKQAEKALQQAYETLEHQTNQLEAANQNLQQTLQELHIHEEELQVQNEELGLARQAAETERQRYQDLFNFAPDGYVVTDANGMIQEANQAVSILLSYNAPILLVSYVDKADRRAFSRFLSELQRHPQPQSCELSLQSSGGPVPVAITAVAIRNQQEQILSIRWLIRDITHRKQAEADLRQSEERYRYLAELIPQLVWTANAEGVLLDVNQRWSNFTGLTLDQAQLAGWEAVIHPDDIPTLSQHWQAAQQENMRYQAEGRMRRADGVYRWHLHQAVPMKNSQGQVIKWFGTATDIEAQKQLEQQRDRILQREQAARAAAEQANRIKDEFLAVLSHELRSPLNPILGWTKLLQTRQFDRQATQRALETIERNAKLQTQLIEDLLDVSRILRGKLVLHSVPVNLVTTIQAAIETVRLAAEVKEITIQTVFAAEVGTIMGDAARLQQIVWNLLSNAVKFTPQGGQVEVQLSLLTNPMAAEETMLSALDEQQPNPNPPHEKLSLPNDSAQTLNYVQIQVKDTGKGISPEFLPHVFDYFRQEDGKTTRNFGGLGLGLAIVRYLTELHGGTVWAESPGEGQGATFTVTLPQFHQPESQTQPDNATGSPQRSMLSTPLSGLRILAVDDDADMQELILVILQQAGAEVKVATSASEALAILNAFQPDVLISDIGMPTVDGYMLMRQIRALPPEQGGLTPAIALTAYAGELNQKQALQAGFQCHLAKPLEPEILVQTIVALIQP